MIRDSEIDEPCVMRGPDLRIETASNTGAAAASAGEFAPKAGCADFRFFAESSHRKRQAAYR